MPFSVLERRIPSINPPNTGMQLTAPRRDRGFLTIGIHLKCCTIGALAATDAQTVGRQLIKARA